MGFTVHWRNIFFLKALIVLKCHCWQFTAGQHCMVLIQWPYPSQVEQVLNSKSFFNQNKKPVCLLQLQLYSSVLCACRTTNVIIIARYSTKQDSACSTGSVELYPNAGLFLFFFVLFLFLLFCFFLIDARITKTFFLSNLDFSADSFLSHNYLCSPFTPQTDLNCEWIYLPECYYCGSLTHAEEAVLPYQAWRLLPTCLKGSFKQDRYIQNVLQFQHD